MKLGALEAGGTKMVCAITNEQGEILDRASFATGHPDDTIPVLIDYFKNHDIDALGIGCFGPLDLNRKSDTYGCLLKTPKPGWADLNIIEPFKNALKVPVGLDTDVNGAVLGEVIFGAGKGYDTLVYMTVGTGIGCGIYLEGRLLHGMLHPETGHMLIDRHPTDTYEGCCDFHEHCLEGLASGPSIQKRWGKAAVELYDRKEVWQLEAYYLAQAAANIVMCYSPQKIILGGGVMHNQQLYDMILKEMRDMLNGYIRHELLDRDDYIVAPGCGENSGILGAAELGALEYRRESR